MSLTYHVKRIVSPWLAGVGDLVGLPVSLIELDDNGGDMAPEQVVTEIKRAHGFAGAAAPAWVMIRGNERRFDNDLCVFLRVHAQVSIAVEVSGRVSLSRPGDRTPMYSHVVVRCGLPLPYERCKVQLFHSFVVNDGVSAASLKDADQMLVRCDFTGRKYVEAKDDRTIEIVAKYGRGWRLTRPLVPEV